MGDIEWEDGAVCFVGGKQWGEIADYDASYIKAHDFRLNEIRQGDYLEASELDTEQKYNDALEVFELFGAKWGLESCTEFSDLDEDNILIWSSTLNQGASWHVQRKRKITYSQLMAIGKLKRAMIEREGGTVCGKPKEDFVKATDKVKSLQQDFSSEQATLDCKDLDINVVFTGEGVYVLDCINSVEYQLESVDEYSKVVSAIRLLQSKENSR